VSENRPIIIKKVKKVSGGGHHGGAWKVAYADFVTAMMAFFLLMWLLNSTTDEQRAGLAEYFVQRIPLAPMSGGGDSAFQGDSMEARGANADSGKGAAGAEQADDQRVEDASEAADDSDTMGQGAAPQSLEELQDAFESFSGESDVEDTMLRHIRTRVTEDGLVIEVFDIDGAPLFQPGGAEPTPTLRALLDMIASVARVVTNDIAVTGHTGLAADAAEAEAAWGLSTSRADAARRLMEAAGLSPGRLAEVAGRAGTQPLAETADDPRNARVEITLLR